MALTGPTFCLTVASKPSSGLPPSSTYWHFGSKDGLLAATVDYGATKWLEQVPRWDQLAGTPEDRLRRMLTATARSLAHSSRTSRGPRSASRTGLRP